MKARALRAATRAVLHTRIRDGEPRKIKHTRARRKAAERRALGLLLAVAGLLFAAATKPATAGDYPEHSSNMKGIA
jgi:hypothetical protein